MLLLRGFSICGFNDSSTVFNFLVVRTTLHKAFIYPTLYHNTVWRISFYLTGLLLFLAFSIILFNVFSMMGLKKEGGHIFILLLLMRSSRIVCRCGLKTIRVQISVIIYSFTVTNFHQLSALFAKTWIIFLAKQNDVVFFSPFVKSVCNNWLRSGCFFSWVNSITEE